MKLLLVDDDPKFRGLMQRGLRESGLEVEIADSGLSAHAVLEERGVGAFDMLLLDVMMPGRTGWDVLREMRERGDPTPVIFLTARNAVEDRVRGLDLGADDYVIKPFELPELLARIEAVNRRRAGASVLQVGRLRLSLDHRLVELDERRIEMSPREFELLLILARARGRALSRDELLRSVWGIDFDPGTNMVNVLVARLRRRMESAAPGLIRTVSGTGYALDPEVAGGGGGGAGDAR